MKALVLKKYKEFSYEDVPEPQPAADEVLVAVKACGICGSDVHGMDGSTGRRRPPIIMGHEASGIIVQAGNQTNDWARGTRVTFDSTIYCGHCEFCRRGYINLCDNRRVLGVSCEDYRQHGAFAEFVVVPQRILYRVPDTLPFEHAALVEPFSIALHAVQRCPPSLNDSVVVVGAGMIGLAMIQALAKTGCGTLIAVDISTDRLKLAMQCGATHTFNSADDDVVENVRALTGGQGADISYEAVGITPAVELCLRCLRKGGSAVLVGNITPRIDFPLQIAVTRELSVFGSCASRGEYRACLDMLARGELNPSILISAKAPLREGPDWFKRLYEKEPGLLKVVLTP